MAQAELTAPAAADLNDIFTWIATDSSIPRARLIVTRIYLAIERIAVFPSIGRVRHDLDGSPQSYSFTPWLIFYRADAAGDQIIILRVLDERRDLSQIEM